MEIIYYINEKILWGLPMLFLVLFCGVYLMIKTKAAVIVHFKFLIKNTVCTLFSKKDKEKGVSSFAALSTALAATVGTGNITGVALAVRLGGPGAIFWMIVSGIVGMTIKYVEVVLAVHYREKSESGYFGGPMYYMKKGLNNKIMPILFCVFAIFSSFGIGNSVQANAFAGGMEAVFKIKPIFSGIILAVLCFFVLSGGIKRISSVAEILVPLMAILYIFFSGIIIIKNFNKIPECFAMIMRCAFSNTAPVGGFLGASMVYTARIGISRGLFTNEAGLGSAPIAHASAKCSHSVIQGMWGAFEVFLDTIVMCTMTALVILISGVWKSGADSSKLAHIAFSENILNGGYIVSFGLIIFAFASVIAWYYYGESCVRYILKENKVIWYRLIYVFVAFFGCVAEIKTVWEIADTLNALMMIPNIITLIFLGGTAGKITRDYFTK